MDKNTEYQKQIDDRKNFDFPKGLQNYADADVGFEINHVDGLSAWHSNLDAEIMLVAQDFADTKAFIRDKGQIEPNEGKYRYPTNKNLVSLFQKGLGIDIGHPLNPKKKAKLFFTNAVIGLKTEGGMQGYLKKDWIKCSTETFLKPLIELIQPKIIITLGAVPFHAVYSLFKDRIEPVIQRSAPLGNHVGKCFETTCGIKIFPVYHCGASSINFNKKPLEEQLLHWKNIKKHLPK